MFYKLYHRLRHRFTAFTRHGIHSPWVYRFIAEGLQPPVTASVRRALPEGKQAALLYRILHFSGGSQVWLVPGDQPDVAAVAGLAGAVYAGPPIKGGACDVLFFRDAQGAVALLDSCRASLSPGSLVVVDEPYRSPAATAAWKDLKASAGVRMSIDLFHFGLLLFREEFRVKQDFRLRTYDQEL